MKFEFFILDTLKEYDDPSDMEKYGNEQPKTNDNDEEIGKLLALFLMTSVYF